MQRGFSLKCAISRCILATVSLTCILFNIRCPHTYNVFKCKKSTGSKQDWSAAFGCQINHKNRPCGSFGSLRVPDMVPRTRICDYSRCRKDGDCMKVAVIKDEQMDYCREPPFHPPEVYPEYPFADTCSSNRCYSGVRELFFKLGLDRERYGTPEWNPLGDVIKPSSSVVIKPNFVTDNIPEKSREAITTHGSVIRAVVDYAYLALQGQGSITICDGSYMNTDFDQLVRDSGVNQIVSYYEMYGDIKLNVVDLRKEKRILRKTGDIRIEQLSGDPLGYSIIDLAKDSDLYGIIQDYEKFRVSYYNKHEMLKHHNPERNEYFISNTVLNADVVVNIPKLKTHARTGITCAMKNMVGITGIKDWLPHYRSGPAERGGDEYPYSCWRKDVYVWLKDVLASIDNLLLILLVRIFSALLFFSKYIVPFKDDFIGGNWYGNDTLPRTISDLNKILYFADRNGVMRERPQRRVFAVVDGIIGGEGDGPMNNSARKCGVLIAGYNPVSVDVVCAALMGFIPDKIPTLKYALNCRTYRYFAASVEDIDLSPSNCADLQDIYALYNCVFIPPDGWKGHIEYEVLPTSECLY